MNEDADELENWLPLGVAARHALSDVAVGFASAVSYPTPRAATRDAVSEASQRWGTQVRVITRKRRSIEIR